MHRNLILSVFFTLLWSAVFGMQNSNGQVLVAQEEEYGPGHTVLTGFLPNYQMAVIEIREGESITGYFTKRGIQFGGRTKTQMDPAQVQDWTNRLKPIAVKYKSCRDSLQL